VNIILHIYLKVPTYILYCMNYDYDCLKLLYKIRYSRLRYIIRTIENKKKCILVIDIEGNCINEFHKHIVLNTKFNIVM